METLSEAVDRLTHAGYRESFRATGEGLRATPSERVYSPESLVVAVALRFEGPTDPADASILFALRAPDGLEGTWAVAYGPVMDAPDAAAIQRLPRSRPPDR
jgi:hypothetical protein